MLTNINLHKAVEQEYSVRDSSRLPWERNSDVNRSIPICNDSTLELETMPRGSNEADAKSILDGCSIEVFIDDNTDEQKKTDGAELQKQFVGTCNVVADDDDDDDEEDGNENKIDLGVRLREDTVIRRLREDTVIKKFVGSTVFDEPKVENACHHGLVDPTINLKQAMDDINSMFGKPLNFGKARKKKKKNQNNAVDGKLAGGDMFFILPDAEMEKNSTGEGDLFEPTVFTKEAMNEINELFGKTLDF